MKKRILVCLLSLVITVITATSAFAASTGDAGIPLGNDGLSGAAYSVVSAVVNREYDFKDDFYDSYLYDDDFYTEGIFRLNDYNGDVTFTIKNNDTGEEFIYEKTPQAEWSVKASVDHLLYETSQIDASVYIYDLGGDYGIEEVDVPVKITVVSSSDSAFFHKYPSYDATYSAMNEGEDFSVDYDSSESGGKAKITLLKKPWLFSLSLYNAESGQLEDYDPEDHEFEFPTEVEVDDFDPSSESFWFYIPGKLIMDDGHTFGFTLSVNGFRKKAATVDSVDAPAVVSEETEPVKGNAATPDSAGTSSQNTNAVKQSAGAVQTGEPVRAIVLTVALMLIAAFIAVYIKKRKNVL